MKAGGGGEVRETGEGEGRLILHRDLRGQSEWQRGNECEFQSRNF